MKYMIPKKVATSIAIIGSSVLVAVAILIFSPTHTPSAEAGVPWFTSTVVVSSPKEPSVRTYEPGAVVNFRADFVWTYCSNEGGGNIYGRTTSPVTTDRRHTGFTGWRGGAEGQQVSPATTRKLGTGRGERVTVKRPPVRIYKPRAASYTEPMRLPTRPGRYHFKYQIEIRTPEGNISREGRVVFEIAEKEEDPTACPANEIAIIRNNERVCVPQAINLICASSASRIEPGESVTFTATANEQASFTWYSGSGTGGAVIGGPQTGTESSLTRTYSTAGIYQVTALARNARGEYGSCTRGVTVGDVDDMDSFEETVDEFGNIVTNESITTPDGQTINLNRSAGPATITFDLDRPLTNTTCKGTWSAQNVAKCYMVSGDDVANAPSVANSGNQDLSPAKYQVQCLSLRDGSVAKSPERLCRSNLDTREQ